MSQVEVGRHGALLMAVDVSCGFVQGASSLVACSGGSGGPGTGLPPPALTAGQSSETGRRQRRETRPGFSSAECVFSSDHRLRLTSAQAGDTCLSDVSILRLYHKSLMERLCGHDVLGHVTSSLHMKIAWYVWMVEETKYFYSDLEIFL